MRRVLCLRGGALVSGWPKGNPRRWKDQSRNAADRRKIDRKPTQPKTTHRRRQEKNAGASRKVDGSNQNRIGKKSTGEYDDSSIHRSPFSVQYRIESRFCCRAVIVGD